MRVELFKARKVHQLVILEIMSPGDTKVCQVPFKKNPLGVVHFSQVNGAWRTAEEVI